jgi:hypothetical protein
MICTFFGQIRKINDEFGNFPFEGVFSTVLSTGVVVIYDEFLNKSACA